MWARRVKFWPNTFCMTPNYAVAVLVRRRLRSGEPILDPVRRLFDRLDQLSAVDRKHRRGSGSRRCPPLCRIVAPASRGTTRPAGILVQGRHTRPGGSVTPPDSSGADDSDALGGAHGSARRGYSSASDHERGRADGSASCRDPRPVVRLGNGRAQVVPQRLFVFRLRRCGDW